MVSGSGNSQKNDSLSKKNVQELKKRIAELQEGNALLMENLMNCVDENDQLKQKLEQSSKNDPIGDEEERQSIIHSIQELLETDVDLSFLMKIKENNLRVLFEILKNAKGTGKTGK
jgi:outer membrane murein-binding lipoprotein Lpp